MSYMGAAYRAAGDPGFFDVLKTIGKAAIGLVPGGSTALSVYGAIKNPPAPARQVLTASQAVGAGTIFAPPGGGTAMIPRPGIVGAVQRAVPGGASGFTMSGAPRGYHFAKDGSGRVVRNRRTNYTNQRALSRATRRLEGFARQVQRSRKAVKKAAKAF